MDRPPRRLSPAPIVTLIGLASLATGLAGYDWRLSAVACGALLLAFAVVDALRVRKNP